MNSIFSYPGARWWKCDLHLHTSASHDSISLQEIPLKTWLLAIMKTGIDVIAITDHNTGEAIDPIKKIYAELYNNHPSGFRPLIIFPGVELSTVDNTHILAIFDTNKGTRDVEDLLTRLDIPKSMWGETNGVFTQKNTLEVLQCIKNHGALPIPAHADTKAGIFGLPPNSLRRLLANNYNIVIETTQKSSDWPEIVKNADPPWAQIVGSDLHRLPNEQDPPLFTWIKMREPNVDGLEMAVLDARNSVKISHNDTIDLSSINHPWIPKVTIKNTRYMGKGEEFIVHLNPGLNTIIGGRGTGKSSFAEFIRIAAVREEEIPKSLQSELQKYCLSHDEDPAGLLEKDSVISFEYEKDHVRYHIEWSAITNRHTVSLLSDDTVYDDVAGDIVKRFPITIFSQKQIFEMAKNPSSFIDMIDQDPDVGFSEWQSRWNTLTKRYLTIQAKIREIYASLPDKNTLYGTLSDITQKIHHIEKSGYSTILAEYHKVMKTNRAIEIWEESWQNAHESINTLVFQMGAIDPDIADLNPEIPTEALCAQELTEKTKKINELISGITTIADQLKEEWQSWLETKETSPWKKDFDFVVNRYQDLTKKLLEQGIHDISEYGSLIQKKEAIEEEIRSYDSLIEILQEYKRQESELLSEINDHRYQLTEKRKIFLSKYLNGKSQIIMRIIPFGDKSSAEETLREILNIKGNQASFLSSSDDKSGILDTLSFKMNASRQDEKKEEISLSHLNAVKKILYRLCDGEEIDGFDNRLLKSLKKCSPEQLDKIAFWFPKDTLYIGYWDEKKGEYKDITEGSPGQKNAAILYFILRYGTNPLILDQPEDDLDNHLIFNLIVTLLQGLKEKRQVIIITHNANIVVNGNADLIIPFKSEHENTIINNQGTLQDREVREEICSLMEGGRNAFEQRYTRILKE